MVAQPDSSFASIERTLDRVIESLGGSAGDTPQRRAHLIEARRLKSIVANWRAIPPPPEVCDEMLDRVLVLSGAASDAPPMAAPRLEARPETRRPPEEKYTNGAARQAQPEPTLEPASKDGPVTRGHALPELETGRAKEDSSPEISVAEVDAGEYVPEADARDRDGRLHHLLPSEQSLRTTRAAIAVRPAKLPEELDPRLIMLVTPYSERADAYRSLRRRLLSLGNPRTIAVTSASPQEGKTTVAINLALALREGARGPILVIEANVRTPSLATLLGFTPAECFLRQLARHRERPNEGWVAVEQLEPIHVLAVDPSTERPPLLDAVAFTAAMEQLKRGGYEHIIVDTPAILGNLDVNVIADSVDGLVIAVHAMKSKRRALRNAVQQLKPSPILGLVLAE